METISLTAAPRTEVRKKVHQLRKQGKIPAVLYGHGIETTHLQLDKKEFTKVLKTASESSLIDLTIEGGKSVKVLLQDVQLDPLTEEVLHADLHQVRMDEKLETEIPLHFVGESPAVKNEGGILVRSHDHVKVKALPGALVPSIDVDISALTELNAALKIKDLVVPEGIELLHDAEEVLAVVSPPRTEEELKSLEGEVTEDVSAVEGAEKKEEGEEAAEGAVGESPKEAATEDKDKKE